MYKMLVQCQEQGGLIHTGPFPFLLVHVLLDPIPASQLYLTAGFPGPGFQALCPCVRTRVPISNLDTRGTTAPGPQPSDKSPVTAPFMVGCRGWRICCYPGGRCHVGRSARALRKQPAWLQLREGKAVAAAEAPVPPSTQVPWPEQGLGRSWRGDRLRARHTSPSSPTAHPGPRVAMRTPLPPAMLLFTQASWSTLTEHLPSAGS